MNGARASIVIAAVVLGLAFGLGSYTFVYARGWAYLTDDPGACANCHVMNEQYDGWITSSHRAVAVCNDCHVPHNVVAKYVTKATNGFSHSYYFTTGGFPEPIYEYYREANFTDWTHADTGASTLKAQHPEFEMWSQGIHARSGVTCADCHMPYMRQGAQKISDHHVRSPLLNINRACQTCHKWSEEELRGRVETIQGRTVTLRNRAMDALVALIGDIKAARAAGTTGPMMTAALEFQRQGQFYVDFVESENSNGFHAPQEAARILGEAIDYVRQGQLALRPAHSPAPSSPVAAQVTGTPGVRSVTP